MYIIFDCLTVPSCPVAVVFLRPSVRPVVWPVVVVLPLSVRPVVAVRRRRPSSSVSVPSCPVVAVAFLCPSVRPSR